jgi:hypothetical protein
MRAAIYIASHPGDRYDKDLARAHAFCQAHGLEPRRHYPVDFLLSKGQLSAFFAAAACGVFEVLVAPSPDCFPTRFLNQLLATGTGLACYESAGPSTALPTR